MEIEDIRALYDEEQRRNVPIVAMRREETPGIVRYVDEHGTSSVVLYSQLDESNVERVIDEQIAYFKGLGHEFEWKVFGHDAPPDLAARLAAHGLEPDELEAIVVLEIADLPAVLTAPVTHDIRRITDPNALQPLADLEEQVWGDDRSWLRDSLSYELQQTPEFLSVYMAYEDGQPAATAWIRFDQRGRWAGLWGGSTLPQFRKRGIYTALVALRTQEARERGVQFLTVDASPMSRPILEKLGFRQMTTALALMWADEN